MRSGSPPRAGAKCAARHCPCRGQTRCWCAPFTPASAAARSPLYSMPRCHPASTSACGHPSKPESFRRRSNMATSASGASRSAPRHSVGATFCLYPHQTRYVVPAAAVHLLPEGVAPERAVLAANLETAVNGLWDGAHGRHCLAPTLGRCRPPSGRRPAQLGRGGSTICRGTK